MSYNVTLIPGTGVGPQTAAVVREAVARLGVEVSWEEHDGSDVAAMIASIKKNGLALKGKIQRPPPVGKVPYVIHYRKALGIHTIVRHVVTLPGLPARASGIDIAIIREASEDIYAGFEHSSTTGVFETVKVTTRASCERISRYAFAWARANGRKRVTTVHKSNILKKADGMFLQVSEEIAAEYPDIKHDEVIVDALCMKLVRWPQDFDVLLCGNLFGDIVSDCVAGMAGGVTVACGVNLGDGVVVFENPHGTTEAEVGKEGANPYPMLGLTVDLLRHLGETAAAEKLKEACVAALLAGHHTADMGGSTKCSTVAEAVFSRIGDVRGEVATA